MRLVRKGYSNQEIAGQLLISEATVKKHLSNIFEKMGISRRTQLF
ncbi:MAG: response regulator transcription factor [Roseburia intestinalis]